MIYNVYCDETCHLEHDGINDMVLGAVWCPQDRLKEINKIISKIKLENGIPTNLELKWSKISPAKVNVYKDIVNFFFDEDNLHLRAIIIPDKSKLNHAAFHQTHDDWYYKMYFDMLKVIFTQRDNYKVYIDIKDNNSTEKSRKLREVCCNSIYDFSSSIIKCIQPIRSEEIQIMQLVDILIGAIGYENRIFPDGFSKSSAKTEIVNIIKTRSNYTLRKSTLLREEKCNLLVWDARGI